MSEKTGTAERVMLEASMGDLTVWVGNLEGRLLTIVDASYSDKKQREALKSIVRNSVWGWAKEFMDGHTGEGAGIPPCSPR